MSKIIKLDCGHDTFVSDDFEYKPFYTVICKECNQGYTFLFGR